MHLLQSHYGLINCFNGKSCNVIFLDMFTKGRGEFYKGSQPQQSLYMTPVQASPPLLQGPGSGPQTCWNLFNLYLTTQQLPSSPTPPPQFSNLFTIEQAGGWHSTEMLSSSRVWLPFVITDILRFNKGLLFSLKLTFIGGCQYQFVRLVTPYRNFSNYFLKTTRSEIAVQILVLVSMKKIYFEA